jgi:phosphoribosyl-AMP cyclohydrolase
MAHFNVDEPLRPADARCWLALSRPSIFRDQEIALLSVSKSLSHEPSQIPDFSKAGGLLPVVAQDAATGEVLMLAYMNAESFAETLATGRAVYFSRGRNQLWRKGEESGHVQLVKEIFVDCDADTLLLKVEQVGGAACHEGYRSCFFRQMTPEGPKIVAQRVFDPAKVYGKKHP